MKSRKSIFIKLIIGGFFALLNLTVKSQTVNKRIQTSCKDVYNRTLSYYNKGQFENIEDNLSNCINEFQNNKKKYTTPGQNVDLVFKVYKLIITSYKNIDKDNLADEKLDELQSFVHDIGYTKAEFMQRFDDTSLDFVK